MIYIAKHVYCIIKLSSSYTYKYEYDMMIICLILQLM